MMRHPCTLTLALVILSLVNVSPSHILREHKIAVPEVDAPREADVCFSVVAIAGTPDPEYDSNINTIDEEGRNLGKKLHYREEEEFVCELASTGELIPLKGNKEQLNSLIQYLNNGDLVSGETTIEGLVLAESALIANTAQIAPGKSASVATTEALLPPGNLILKPGNPSRRRLASYEGTKQVLVVRVIDKDGRAHDDSPAVISDKIFGTYGDNENMANQFHACSFGKLYITNLSAIDISPHLAAPGVIEVVIPVSLTDTEKSVIRNEVTKAVEFKLGGKMPGNFDHVMYILERCYVNCGWAAYALVNSWNTVFQGKYYRYPGVQLHELGHNLNLAHSGGLDGKPYSDHSCLMGNPIYADNVAKMCYNPAKNFQIAYGSNSWYKEYIMTWDSGTRKSSFWKGKIVGIADYDNNPESHPVVIKLETGTDDDYFLAFNRAYRVNQDNKQADDQITIVLAGNNGLGYSQSWLKATLSQGDSYEITNWRGTKRHLVITVNEIDIANADPGYADVTLNYGSASVPNPTLTAAPVSSPVPPSKTGTDIESPNVTPTPKPTKPKRYKHNLKNGIE